MEISEFDPKKLSELEIKEFYELYLERHGEATPMLPHSSFEAFRIDFAYVSPMNLEFLFQAREDSKLIGTAVASIYKPTESVPQADSEKSWMRINVKKEFRRKGTGTLLLQKLMETVSGFNRIKKTFIWSSLESGKSFCRNLGGKIASSGYFSILDLKNLDWTRIIEMNKSLLGETPNVSITITDGLKDEDRSEYMNMLCELCDEISKYSNEWDFNETLFREEYTLEEKRSIEKGELSIIAYARNKNGFLAGMSELMYKPDKPQEAYTEISGTAKDFRGSGLCKRMKTELLIYLKNNYPQVTFVNTENDKDNAVMRNINKQLGFTQLPVSKGYSFKIMGLKIKLGM